MVATHCLRARAAGNERLQSCWCADLWGWRDSLRARPSLLWVSACHSSRLRLAPQLFLFKESDTRAAELLRVTKCVAPFQSLFAAGWRFFVQWLPRVCFSCVGDGASPTKLWSGRKRVRPSTTTTCGRTSSTTTRRAGARRTPPLLTWARCIAITAAVLPGEIFYETCANIKLCFGARNNQRRTGDSSGEYHPHKGGTMGGIMLRGVSCPPS